jgi:hypothetical protein
MLIANRTNRGRQKSGLLKRGCHDGKTVHVVKMFDCEARRRQAVRL